MSRIPGRPLVPSMSVASPTSVPQSSLWGQLLCLLQTQRGPRTWSLSWTSGTCWSLTSNRVVSTVQTRGQVVPSVHRNLSKIPECRRGIRADSDNNGHPDISQSNLTEEQKSQATELLRKYQDVFSATDDGLGFTETVTHKIVTTDDEPVKLPFRRLPPAQYQEVKEHIRELLSRNVIRPSTSPYASPIVIVRRKDGNIRLCVDYRRLNVKTRRDAFPLPRVEESFDALNGARLFSSLDLTAGYNQVAVDPTSDTKLWGNQVCRVIRTQLYSCILHLAGMLRLGVCQPNNYNYKTGNKHLSSSTI